MPNTESSIPSTMKAAVIHAWNDVSVDDVPMPAVGPGDQAAHARQRRLLGRWAAVRLAVANVGVAGLALGWPIHGDVFVVGGAVLLAIGLGSTAALVAAAVALGVGAARSNRSADTARGDGR